MGRTWALGALALLFSIDLHAEGLSSVEPALGSKLSTLNVRVAPEWAYRHFVDSEPSSTNKTYAASGIFGFGAQVDVFPFAARADTLRDCGLVASYGRAIGLGSIDVDSKADVGTVFYRFDAGLQYRLPSRSALSFTFFAAYERWVFEFDEPATPLLTSVPSGHREVPTARYSLAKAGTAARLALGALAFLGNVDLMLPLSIAPLGDREPTAGGFGAKAKVGVAFDLLPVFAVDLSGGYTLFIFHLPSVPGRSDAPGRVLDQYLVASLGFTLKL